MTRQIQTVVVVALFAGVPAVARQSAAKPKSTGIPECDKYAAMVVACLPKMCEVDRMVVELGLGMDQELLPTVVKLKGRQEAARQCAAQIDEAIKDDLYGCHAPKAGTAAPMPVRLDRIQPTDSSVTLTFSGTGPPNGEEARLAIFRFVDKLQPIGSYRLTGWKAPVVLDTLSASPVAGAPNSPIRLEPGTEYCFVVESGTDGRRHEMRKGIFMTLPKR